MNFAADVTELVVAISCSSFFTDLASEGAVVKSTGEYVMSPVVKPGVRNSVADVTELVVAISFSRFFAV